MTREINQETYHLLDADYVQDVLDGLEEQRQGNIRAEDDTRKALVNLAQTGAEALNIASTAAAEARDAGAQAMLSGNADVTYLTDAEREAAAPTDGTISYTVESRLTHQRQNGAWVQVGEGAASASTVKNINMIVRNIITPEQYGAVGGGGADDTAAWQAMLQAWQPGQVIQARGESYSITVPEYPAVYGMQFEGDPERMYRALHTPALRLKSGMTLELGDNTTMIVNPNDKDNHSLFGLWNVENVGLYGGRAIGDRAGHLGGGGEWGYAVDIRGNSKNIDVDMGLISDMWGDAYFIGPIRTLELKPETYRIPENIRLWQPYTNNNRRQGMSVQAVRGLRVFGGSLSGTKGTLPAAGCDIEPERGDTVSDVRFEGTEFADNEFGLLLAGDPNSTSNVRGYNLKFLRNRYGHLSIANNPNDVEIHGEFTGLADTGRHEGTGGLVSQEIIGIQSGTNIRVRGSVHSNTIPGGAQPNAVSIGAGRIQDGVRYPLKGCTVDLEFENNGLGDTIRVLGGSEIDIYARVKNGGYWGVNIEKTEGRVTVHELKQRGITQPRPDEYPGLVRVQAGALPNSVELRNVREEPGAAIPTLVGIQDDSGTARIVDSDLSNVRLGDYQLTKGAGTVTRNVTIKRNGGLAALNPTPATVLTLNGGTAEADAPPGSLFMQSGVLKFKDSQGVVKTVTLT